MVDVVVVGGGTAGCVLAPRIAAHGERAVVLLEAGPDLRAATPSEWRDGWRLPHPPDWGFVEERADGTAGESLRRGRVLGGTSWLTRFAVRGAPADFDAWAARGNPGWAFEDVLPTFRRIESDLEFGHEPWHGMDGPIPVTRYPDLGRSAVHGAVVAAVEALGVPAVADHNDPTAIGVGPLPMSSRAGVRATALDGYLGTRPPAGLTIRPDALVARVRLERGRAVGVELADGTTIPADHVILAAGTYGSPTILHRSGIGPAEALRDLRIAPIIDLPGVGENLADHPGVDLDSGWRGRAASRRVLHSIVTSRSTLAEPDGPPDLMLWISDPTGDEPRLYLDPILLKPESRGSVRLRSSDPADPPRIVLPGVRTERDLARLVEGYRFSLAVANERNLRPLLADGPPLEPATADAWHERIHASAYSLPHVTGTCAMGPDPAARAVVDALGRVHGVEGLSVADASIIPEPPSGFPHLITIMLAEHLAGRPGAFG